MKCKLGAYRYAYIYTFVFVYIYIICMGEDRGYPKSLSIIRPYRSHTLVKVCGGGLAVTKARFGVYGEEDVTIAYLSPFPYLFLSFTVSCCYPSPNLHGMISGPPKGQVIGRDFSGFHVGFLRKVSFSFPPASAFRRRPHPLDELQPCSPPDLCPHSGG